MEDMDLDALYVALDRKRRAERMSWRDVARDTGVPGSTFTRLGRGITAPSLWSYTRMCRWLGSPAPFVDRQQVAA